jgi:hypothetical protein
MAYTDIDKPDEYFNTIIWSGDSSSPENLTVGFQPDLIWGKLRNTAYNHQLYDSVRGFGNDKDLQSSQTTAEGGGTADQYGYISGTTSTGFTATKGSDVGADGYGYWNESGRTYVAWNWLANGAGVSNTDGSITSTVSASTTSGFSIVSYTGTGSAATIGHGLSTSPSMILIKNRTTAYSWIVYHKSLGATKNLYLDLTGASDISSIQFNDTEPTSSVFSVGTSLATNKSSDSIIAYCFAEKKGFSKFGSYIGNGSTNGTFVYTGFKPAFILYKNSTAGGDSWQMFDNKRLGYNVKNRQLQPNSSGAEQTSDNIDILSNGFKQRQTASGGNTSGETYIYMAFAENPFVTSTSIPTTAR